MIFNNNIAGKLMTMAATKNHIWTPYCGKK